MKVMVLPGKGEDLDMHLSPDLSRFRSLTTHRPGYGIVLCDERAEGGHVHPLSPRGVLARQVDRLAALGHEAFVATELECYLFTADWQPVQQHVQYSSLTDALSLEAVAYDMRRALLGAGIPVESSKLSVPSARTTASARRSPASRFASCSKN